MEIGGASLKSLATEQFTAKLSVLVKSSCPLIMVRTREPLRAVQIISAFAKGVRRKMKVWSITSGWSERYSEHPSAPEHADGKQDPFTALREVAREEDDTSIWCLLHPHHFISKHYGVMQLLKEYAFDFPSRRRCVVLVVPLGYAPPQEIEDDLQIIDFDVPSFAELIGSVQHLVESIDDSAKRPSYTQEEIARIVSAGVGMTRSEFESAIARSLVENAKLLPNVPAKAVLDAVLSAKTEVVKRSEILELMAPESMESVGGLANLKAWVAKRRRCFSDEARAFGIDPPKGIALIGPPGTGKSLSAKAIASELGLPLVRFDVSRVFGSLVGQSEERVRSALKMIESMAPVVVMIDEIDKIFNINSGGDSGVSTRVLGAILTEMQEQKAPIFWVATANRTRNLPSEFLRRGRLDEVFSVSVPDESERLEILRIHLAKRGHDPDTIEDLDEAARVSEGFVPAELEAAVKDSLIEAFDRGVAPSGALIVESLSTIVPLSEAFKEDFQAMEQWAAQNARPAGGGDRAAPAAPVRKRLVVRPRGRAINLS